MEEKRMLFGTKEARSSGELWRVGDYLPRDTRSNLMGHKVLIRFFPSRRLQLDKGI